MMIVLRRYEISYDNKQHVRVVRGCMQGWLLEKQE